MLELVFEHDSARLQKHRMAPFLEQRETYLAERGRGIARIGRLQIIADRLLFAIEHLPLMPADSSTVSIERVVSVSIEWEQLEKTKERPVTSKEGLMKTRTGFITDAVALLGLIGRLDARLADENNIINKLKGHLTAKINYHIAPMYDERISFLSYLETQGHAPLTIKEYASLQLPIIRELNLDKSLRPIRAKELSEAADSWNERCNNPSHNKDSARTRKTFLNVGERWLSFLGLFVPDMAYTSITESTDDYCMWMKQEKGLADTTIEKTMRTLSCFGKWLDENGLIFNSLTLIGVDSFLHAKEQDGCGRKQINNIITDLRGFFRYQFEKGRLDVDLSKGMRSWKQYRLDTLPESPEWEDVVRLCSFYDGEDPNSLRSNVIVNAIAVYGFRSIEIARLRLCDIDWENETILIQHAKGEGSGLLPLDPRVGNAILRYVVEGRNNDAPFEQLLITTLAPYKPISGGIVYQTISKACKALGIKCKHIGGHSLRKACATRLINSGVPLNRIGNLLGHKCAESTMIYSKVDFVNLRKVADMNWEDVL